MNVNKAVITLAGPNQRALPMQTLVDRDGQEKSVLTILIAEILQAGIEEICLVVAPGDATSYAAAVGDFARRLHFVEQAAPNGYGHAIATAAGFVGDDSFLHLVGDHLYVSSDGKGSAAKFVQRAAAEGSAMSAVKATRERLLPYYGVIGGQPVPGQKGLYVVREVLEKPTPTIAEQRLIVPGMRAGHYLCLFGMHVLTPTVMVILADLLERSANPRGITLSHALNVMAGREKYLAIELEDMRYDLGVKYGLLQAQLALGLSGRERDEVLSMIVELLAVTSNGRGDPMSPLVEIITSTDPAIRNRSLDRYCREATMATLLDACDSLERLRRQSENLYHRVRALFFLYAIYRFHLPGKPGILSGGHIPHVGHSRLLQRRFEEAINHFGREAREHGLSDALTSALATAYYQLAFQTLADQVRRSVRSVRGNQWMFRVGHASDHPLRIRPELLVNSSTPPILHETTPVRMDLTHSGWSDIFFLGMDFPEGARVINTSIDLAVRAVDGGDADGPPRPPIETYLRIIDRPVLRLVSVDLEAETELTEVHQVFDYAADYLGLLKGAVIAAGIVPPGMEGANQRLGEVLNRLMGPGRGLELVSKVNGIPKGSRLAVSTNLLASLIAICMRATGQTESIEGQLTELERRQVAARAILGEWLAGSGGGWQDSGGVWPGMKLIEGVEAKRTDPEYGISRGRLLPKHTLFDTRRVAPETRQLLQDSLVLVHGGMAQNVGPILEMVTEKYLLRSEAEWAGRLQAMALLDDIVAQLEAGDVKAIGASTQRNFEGPIQTIIPWASNLYTEVLIEQVRAEFGETFWGFWMLGGMAGGGMGFIFDPVVKRRGQRRLQEIMTSTKQRLDKAVPFAMNPVVYDFAINEQGTICQVLTGKAAVMPDAEYGLQTVPVLLRRDPRQLSPMQRTELARYGSVNQTTSGQAARLLERLLPTPAIENRTETTLAELLQQNGFDAEHHEQIRADLRSGRIGLAQNRLPVNSQIEDVKVLVMSIVFREATDERIASKGRSRH